VVDADIVPGQRLAANPAIPLLITVPDDSSLLGGKQSLFVFAIEY
jgi:hypothetical protein